MKSIFSLLLILCLGFTGFAQNSNRSVLHIRLSDGQPLIVTINNRDYKRVNTKITIADVPGKRHRIQVYRFRPYADGNGGKAELVYSGNFKIRPGSVYDCVVDINSRKLLVKDLGVNGNASTPQYMPPPPPNIPNSDNDVAIGSEHGANSVQNIDAKLLRLHQQILDTKEDSKKLAAAEQYISNNNLYTADLKTIASWIMFDDNKMKLMKSAYNQLLDKQNYSNLVDVFTMDDAKNEFKAYAKEKGN